MLNPCICNAIALSACWLGGGGRRGPMHEEGGRRALSKTKLMWLETPVAQGRAQGPRKVQGAPGRQGGIVDKIPAPGSPCLLTD